MTSKYAMALYELVQLRAGLDRCIERFSVEAFVTCLAYPRASSRVARTSSDE
jgi:hypothetical protein